MKMKTTYAIYTIIVACIAAAIAPSFINFVQTKDECQQQASKMSANPFDHAQTKRFEDACKAYGRAATQLSNSIPISK